MNQLTALLPESALDPEILVYLAMAAYVGGLVIKNQVTLRLMLLVGTFFYIAYYYVASSEPLWAAIYTSTLIAAANLVGLTRLLHGRMEFWMNDRERRVYNAIGSLRPGEFRKLIRIGEIMEPTSDLLLTTEGDTPDRLFFVVEGALKGQKSNARFAIPHGHFIGEVSFVLGSVASASVTLSSGGFLIAWRREELSAEMRRSDDLRQSVEAMLSRDMALKVAGSIHIDALAEVATVAPADRDEAHGFIAA